jgi:hypothetical protein
MQLIGRVGCVLLWTAQTCLRFGTTRHVASKKAASSHRSPNKIRRILKANQYETGGTPVRRSPAERRHHHSEGNQQNDRSADHRAGDCGETIFVLHPRDDVDDERKRRRQNYGQPAKGCNGRASPRMQQNHQRDRRWRDERQTQPDLSRIRLRLVQQRWNWIARVHAEKFSHLRRHVNNGAAVEG